VQPIHTDVNTPTNNRLGLTGGHERRRDARLALQRPVKIQCAQTGRYLAGRTRDLSAGGALLEVDHPSLLVAGQRLRVGVGWTSQQMLLRQDDLAQATVVRSLALGATQTVAVCFDQRQQLAAAV
jgi:hypothetical protein